ncbi:MAG: CinA-like protein [Chlamydiae bacterium]|nr:CinA-like protein [Chlamydiota bacterium]
MLIEERLQSRFLEKKMTLSLAESITGGAMASRLVKIPDASLYFQGSVVAYANSAKERLLAVSPELLQTHGAVSKQVAEAMAEGARQQFISDYSLAVTGIAGPSGGTPEKPVGTVCFAIASNKGAFLSWTSRFEGNRLQIIDQATEEAFSRLLSQIG